ncbi:LppP/LprE family lipoprotein [Nocardia stercoris]|uniref:LppP/LprE family lipoprotein n=1 Tax=Nocardia stercoris TaxID=2483361 RepID=A0A3M2LE23_9NOCA|nr:LppP/LprE family lipoprotein [Nocardia stercoris]
MQRLSGGPWQVDEGSTDPISAGCDGLLSWMTVETGGIHAPMHILFFTGGTYLGTATSQPHAYTQVSRQSANVVQAQYHWPLDGDALCCPQGSGTVTFTLTGTTVQANGQFPPN